MGDLLRHFSVGVVRLFLLLVGQGPTVLHHIVGEPVLQRYRVGDCRSPSLVDCIENLKGLATDDFIVSVDKEGDLVGLAELGDRQVDVGDSSYSLEVDNYLHLA